MEHPISSVTILLSPQLPESAGDPWQFLSSNTSNTSCIFFLRKCIQKLWCFCFVLELICTGLVANDLLWKKLFGRFLLSYALDKPQLWKTEEMHSPWTCFIPCWSKLWQLSSFLLSFDIYRFVQDIPVFMDYKPLQNENSSVKPWSAAWLFSAFSGWRRFWRRRKSR